MRMKISQIFAREILDSRGYPTVETVVGLENGMYAVSSVPSGASTGTHEAVELRDNDPQRFMGKGVLQAVANVNTVIAPVLIGADVTEQEILDKKMLELDGTVNKGRLGANAILSISEALLKLAAQASGKALYQYVYEMYGLTKKFVMPQPTLNVINGGKHGNGKLEFQEFHILPHTQQTFVEMMRMGTEVYLNLQKLMKENGIFQGVGDEGGFTGNFRSNKEGLDYLEMAIEKTGYELNKDVKVGLDSAATEFYGEDGKYHISDKSFPLTREDMIAYYQELSEKFNFGYLEDGLAEDDWEGWQKLTKAFSGTQTAIIGDDLLTTNPSRVEKAIELKACNAVLVKPNQIGSVTEVIDVVTKAKKAGWKIVLSHRSGETNDTFVSDFAVGVGADIVKFGAPARGERIAKYNRLMEIEQELKK